MSNIQPERPVGALIASYGRTRSIMIVSWLLAALFIGVGLFGLWLPSTFGGNVRYTGSISALYGGATGAIAFGLAVVLGSWLLYRGWPTVHLHDNAIRVVSSKEDRTDFYEDIDDTYTYSVGLRFGYHSPARPAWVFIAGHVQRYGELNHRFHELHAEQRSARLYQDLLAGRSATFHCLEEGASWSKTLWGTKNMNVPRFDLVVTSEHLELKGKRLPLRRLADISSNAWLDRAQFVDVDGKVFHSMHSSGVMSLGVLYELLLRLQGGGRGAPVAQERAPAGVWTDITRAPWEAR